LQKITEASPVSDFLHLISALAAGYLVKGWPFLLAHILVAYLVSRSWHRLNRERRALESWDIPSIVADKDEDSSASAIDKAGITTPNSASPPKVHAGKKPETIVVLERFVDESRVMGAKGFFVPMTDFSDRLDSAVEGKIAELHDRTNLFLYVGIAGTMFGVFEFAHRSYTLITSNVAQSDKLIKLGEYLSGSMSRAFPVGFFGLLFTFIAQIIATRPEQRLREELSEATRKALEARKSATHSQGEIILKASADIGEAMAPLKNLEKTLSEGLKPVVEVFGERLDKSLGLIEAQFKRLETTSLGLEAAVGEVKAAVGSIADATKSLNSLIKETPKVINRLLDLEKKHEGSLEKIDALFMEHFKQADQLSNELQKAVGNLSTLSDQVIAETTAGISRIETASVGSWTSAAKDLREKVEAELGQLFEDAARRMTEINSTVDKALNVMNDVGLVSADSIAAVGKLAPEIAENYKVSLDKVGGDSLKQWIELSEKLFAASQRQYLAYLDAVQAGTLESSTALKNAATEWDTIARYAPQILREPVQAAVAEAQIGLESHLTRLDTNLADRIRQFSIALTDLQNSTNQLVVKVGDINKDLSNWAAAASPLTKDIRTATESIRRQSESQVGIVKRLESAAEKITRVANRPTPARIRVPTSGSVVKPLPRERTWWKPHTWFRRR
jgi:methyl-accepting chemotaxis protein